MAASKYHRAFGAQWDLWYRWASEHHHIAGDGTVPHENCPVPCMLTTPPHHVYVCPCGKAWKQTSPGGWDRIAY